MMVMAVIVSFAALLALICTIIQVCYTVPKAMKLMRIIDAAMAQMDRQLLIVKAMREGKEAK